MLTDLAYRRHSVYMQERGADLSLDVIMRRVGVQGVYPDQEADPLAFAVLQSTMHIDDVVDMGMAPVEEVYWAVTRLEGLGWHFSVETVH